MAAPNICVGCGFEVDSTGVLNIAGPRPVRQDGVTPMEWPYDGSIDDEFPDTRPYGLALGNGLFQDHSDAPGECRIAAFPNSTARVVQGSAVVFGPGGQAAWSIVDGAFDPPWSDSALSFALTEWVELELRNPSINRPMIVRYLFDWGPTVVRLDKDVSLSMWVEGKIWDDPLPEPAAQPLSWSTPFIGDRDGIAHQIVGHQCYELLRKNGTNVSPRPGGPIPVLATYLAPSVPAAAGGPDSVTHFKARLMGSMMLGTATTTPGQIVSIAGTLNAAIHGMTV